MKRLLITATVVAALSGCVALPYDEPYAAYPAAPVYSQPYYAPGPAVPVYPAPVYVGPPVQFSFGYWEGHGGYHHHYGRGFGGHHFGGGGHGWRR